MPKKLDDDVLDALIEKVCTFSLGAVETTCDSSLPQDEKIQYLCRAFTEILGVLIISSPKNELETVHKNVIGWLNSVVAYNAKMSELSGIDVLQSYPSLETIFRDMMFISPEKKVKA
jgi:hypothetical protein